MSWLFGKKKEVDPNHSINKMKDTLEVLEKREKHLTKQIEKETAEAKGHMAKNNKKAALLCLKRKKIFEGEIEKLNAQMMNVQTMSMKLESTVIDMETFKAQQEGAKAMKNIFKSTNVDKIDVEMEKVRDTMEDAREISDAISQPLGTDVFDEGELEDELAQLEAEMNDQNKVDVEINIPKNKISGGTKQVEEPVKKVAVGMSNGGGSKKHDVDDELAQLEAEFHGK
jgi:charged multivesicular body protein 4